MLNTNYNFAQFSKVQSLTDFYKSDLPEVKKVHAIVDTVKVLYGLNVNQVELEVAEGQRFYRVTMLTPDIHKLPFGWFVYLPEDGRLDLYSVDNPIVPVLQWKKKKVAFKNYSTLFDLSHVERLFERVVNQS